MKAPSESSRSNSRARGSGVIELNKMTAILAKLDAIMHKLGNLEKRLHYAHEIGGVGRVGIRRSVEGPIEEDPYQVEEANYLNEQRSYQFKPNPNLPTHYTPALRGHENFSYGGGASQGPRQGQDLQQGYNPPRFQRQQQQGENKNEYQGQKRAQSFEEQMLQFMRDNNKMLNNHEQKFYELETFKSNTQIFQANTNASLKNLETQVGQLASTL